MKEFCLRLYPLLVENGGREITDAINIALRNLKKPQNFKVIHQRGDDVRKSDYIYSSDSLDESKKLKLG